MAFHHVAIASRDIKASHEFYTGAMGFTLVKAQASRSGARTAGPSTCSTTPEGRA
jgi:catechol 2,3-dioxygenase-like lactoylglutathione lyase family enzyme